MSDAPERLWAWCFNGDKFGGWRKWGGYARPENRYPLNEKERQTGAEYIRADLPRPQDAERIAELEKALEEARHAITEASDPDFLFGAMDNSLDMDSTLEDYAAAASRAIRAAVFGGEND